MTGPGVGDASADRPPAGFGLDDWMSPPYSRWAFQHVEDFLPTAVISRGTGPTATLPASSTALADVPMTDVDGAETDLGAVMSATDTDGWAIAHRGVLVAEHYSGSLTAHTRHLVFSVSKSLVGAVAAALHDAGAIEFDTPVTDFVPALADCGYAGATVRHLLDMRSGIDFCDDYGDPGAEIHLLDQSFGWAPRRDPDAPATLQEFLLTLRAKSAHGGPFQYRSCETDVLGWICEVAGGRRMPGLMSELLWSRIGAQDDATIGVDAAGTGMFNGGVSTCLTDLIRFGALFLRDGVSLTGRQVLSPAWVADTLGGGPDSRQAFAACPDDTELPGGMYRNQMWFPYPGNDVVLCLGMCGQMIYINRPAEVVAAKVSTQPHSQEPHMLNTLRAFDAAVRELTSAARQTTG